MMDTASQEITQLRVLADLAIKFKPIIDSTRLLIGYMSAFDTHAIDCKVCRLQAPNHFTCPVGFAAVCSVRAQRDEVMEKLGGVAWTK